MSQPLTPPPVDMGEAILRSLAGGMARQDTVAFLAFYAALCPEVYARLLVCVPDPARATALTESVFLDAWRTAPVRDGAEPVRAWLAGIVQRHTGAVLDAARIACVTAEFRRLLSRAEADAETLRTVHRAEPQ
jgi:DNA-directed RNA polymerase specialized sigma24 family protein